MKQIVLCALLLAATPVHAGDAPPRLNIWNSLYGRVNPLGLEDWLMVGLQQPLYRATHAALADNWIWWGALVKSSPSSVKVGPHLEIMPLSILQLRFTAELGQWFGVFTTFQSFGSPLDDWSDSQLYKLAEQHKLYATTAVHLGFQPTLQVAFGPIVIRDTPSFDYWNARLRPGDTVFYDGTADSVLAPDSWVISNDADLFYRNRKLRLIVGVRHTLVQPFYPATAYRPGETISNPNGQQRLSAVAVWNFYNRPTGRVHAITAAVTLGWYLSHRFRTGQDVPWGVPVGLAGLIIETDVVR